MYRGYQIDRGIRDIVEKHPKLSRFSGKINRGPYFYDAKTGEWWDMTTEKQWHEHEKSYGPGGTLINTEGH